MKKLRAYAELIRLPNVFTALADILAGYWAASGRMVWSEALAALMIASGCLYSAGIVLNDLRDLEVDRAERPQRPLPSRRVSLNSARILLIALCLVGVIAAILAGRAISCARGPFGIISPPSLITVCLLAFIFGYDTVFKNTFVGPFVMGACRAFNLLLGMSPLLFAMPQHETNPFIVLVVAYWLYIASLTYFGREEVAGIQRRQLIAGMIGILLALAIMGTTTIVASGLEGFTLVLWLVLVVHLTRIMRRAIKNPVPQQVQFAMKTLILSIIVFDATIAAAAAGWMAAVVILALLVPTVLLAKKLYVT